MKWIVLGIIILGILAVYFIADVLKTMRRIKQKVEQGVKTQKKAKKGKRK